MITFRRDELPVEATSHNKALHVTVKCGGKVVSRVLVDGGSGVNICPLSTLRELGIHLREVKESHIRVRAFDGSQKSVTKDAVLRPSNGEEGTKSPVPKPGKDKKCKAASRSEGPKPETRRVRKKAIAFSIDSVQRLKEEEEDEEKEEEEGDASALVSRSARAIEVTDAPEPIAAAISRFRVNLSQCEAELQKVSGERDSLRLLCSQKDEAIKDLQADLAKAREEEAKLDKQVSLVMLKYGFDSTVEVNPSLSQLQQKVEMIESLGEEVGQIKAEYNGWKETIDRLAAEKETILTNLLSADVQLRNIKQKCSTQAKRVEDLEAHLAETKAEVESSKILVDKSITVYRADAEAAQMEAREAADTADTRAHWFA
ncbi:uncharacterized protein [Nicotiana tomentosiformis]|uniref:uncharacterized protein n=1 Tax=Nicotiana tomentosiformis TaxID=4098 RepID=UPI00388CD463